MKTPAKILPHLWFDKEAREATEFYCSVFPDSGVTHLTTLHDTPSGDCDIVNFHLNGQPFMAISAGPLFKFNPSTSFIVNYDPSRDSRAEASLRAAWALLSEGGEVLMALQEYPFSKLYGWVQDRYGLSWHLMLTDPAGEERPFITPSLMFVGQNWGKAEEASDYYISVFRHSCRGQMARYPAGMEPDKEGTVMFTDFALETHWFAAMDSAGEHPYGFNEAISFIVQCETQDEIDYYWEKLSAFPEAEECGWCKDRYGLSWQINPTALGEMMTGGSPGQIQRVTQAFLKMKKFDIESLKWAYEGK